MCGDIGLLQGLVLAATVVMLALWVGALLGMFTSNRDAPSRKQMDDDLFCPVCGYYCLGKGGRECLDKPTLVGLGERDA